MSVHSEKIDHAVNRLTDAGLASDSSVSTSSKSGGVNKWAIIGGAVGGAVLLIVLALVGYFLWRRRRKAKAYSMVHRGVDVPNATGRQNMSGGLIPLWMSNNNPSISHTPPTAHPDRDNEKLRRYSTSGLPAGRESFASVRSEVTIGPASGSYNDRGRSRSASPAGRGRSNTEIMGGGRSRSPSRDVFNAERVPSENESMTVRSKFHEGEFGGAYEDVDTGYGGDKRSALS